MKVRSNFVWISLIIGDEAQSIQKRTSDLFPAPLYSRSMAVRLSLQQQNFGGKLRNGAAEFFLLFFNFSYHMATFVKWIVYNNEKCKIVSLPTKRPETTPIKGFWA